MDKFKESLNAAEFETNNLREILSQVQDRSSSLLLFSLRWKDLEGHYESLRDLLSQREKEVHALEGSVQCRLSCFEERCREFEAKMKVWRKEIEDKECEFLARVSLGFEAKGTEIEEKLEALESVRREIAERLVDIEEKERRVERVFEERDREVEKKEKELEELRKETETRKAEIQCRDGELEKKEKDLEELRKKVESREKEIKCRNRELKKKEKEVEELRKRIKMREREIDCRDRESRARRREYEESVAKLDERLQDVERKESESKTWYDERFELLEIRKREAEEKIGKVMLDEEKLKKRCEEIELREKKLDERIEEVVLKEKRLEGLAEKLKSGERELEEKVKEANLKGQSLEKRLDDFALEKSEFEERFQKGIVWERRLLEGIRELEIREQQLQEQNRKIDVAKNSLNTAVLAILRSEESHDSGVETAVGVVVQHCVVMDGKSLQIFLNEHWEEHDKMRHTVSALLGFCPDPAKLVLDAIVGFYPPHLKHGDCEFEASVVRKSCLLLLEQLMEICPNIKSRVKGEAMKLSFDWITKMSVDLERSIEVVAFLELVSAYGLADAFDANELLDYAENVAHYRQMPKLCRVLGLTGKIPGLIQKLLEREQHLIALRFIVEFNLSDEFPPASLLDDSMKVSENAVKEIVMGGNNSIIEAQDQATTKRIVELEDVIRCIKDHNIISGFSAGCIVQMIDSVEQKASQDKAAAPTGSDLQMTGLDNNNHNDSPVVDAAVSDTADISASADSPLTKAAAPTGSDLQTTELDGNDRNGSPVVDVVSNAADISASAESPPLTKAAAPTGSDLQTTDLDGNDHNDSPVVDAAFSDLADISASADSPFLTNDATVAAAPVTIAIQQEAGVMLEAPPNSDVNIPTSVCPLECRLQMEPTADKGQHFDANGKDLRKLLGEDLAYEMVRDDILCVLKSSSDPARLVLDAMRNDPTKLIGVPVKSCIMLLKDVKKLSPVIDSLVEAEARELAKVWILKLELEKDDHMEVICFMQFLLVYDLCGDFEEGKVYGLLNPSNWLNKFAEDCQLLGLADFIPNFVEHLIAKKCLLGAIGYIYTFKLDDKFPLEPLLSNYLMNATENEENVSPADQMMAMKRKLRAVRAAIKCIDRYSIGAKDMRKCLQDDLRQLEKQKMEETHKLDADSDDFQQQDNVKDLTMLLSGDIVYKSVQDEISKVLKSSLDPAYLVLVTMKSIDPSQLEVDKGFKVGIPIKSCILLLEQLQSIHPKIKPRVHDEARQFWQSWRRKLKLAQDDHMGVLCFMLFFKVYSGQSNLCLEDFIGLLKPFGWKLVSESCQELGLRDVYPDFFIQKLIGKKRQLLKAIKYIYTFRMDDKFPVVRLLRNYLRHRRGKGHELRAKNNNSRGARVAAININLQAARDVWRCVKQHNRDSSYPLRDLENEIMKWVRLKEEAEWGDEKFNRKAKRKQKHWDLEDERSTIGPIGTSQTHNQKKKKRKCESSTPTVKASRESQECPLSYHPMHPPAQLSPPPQPPLPLPLPTISPPVLPPPAAYPPPHQPPLPQPTQPPPMLPPQPACSHHPQLQPQPPHLPPLPPATSSHPPYPYPYPYPECHMNGLNWHPVAQDYNIPPGQHGWSTSSGYPQVDPHPVAQDYNIPPRQNGWSTSSGYPQVDPHPVAQDYKIPPGQNGWSISSGYPQVDPHPFAQDYKIPPGQNGCSTSSGYPQVDPHPVAQDYKIPPGQNGWSTSSGYPQVDTHGPMFCEYGRGPY